VKKKYWKGLANEWKGVPGASIGCFQDASSAFAVYSAVLGRLGFAGESLTGRTRLAECLLRHDSPVKQRLFCPSAICHGFLGHRRLQMAKSGPQCRKAALLAQEPAWNGGSPRNWIWFPQSSWKKEAIRWTYCPSTTVFRTTRPVLCTLAVTNSIRPL
jgi:hypothetical protein